MAEAVAQAFAGGEHLAVQAGTGTGKSLAYLVPAIARAVAEETPVVVSTATIALQRQLVDRDLPRLVDALAGALPRRPQFALLKGRRNYLCLNKIHNGGGEENAEAPQEELFEPVAATALGRDVARLTAWASSTETGDRDELTPGVPDRSWSQVSVSARECLGMARCPYGTDCFSERARGRSRPRRDRRHQPRTAGHRRDRRRLGAARTRLPGGRRGPRTGGPGDVGGHRRADPGAARCGHPAHRPAGQPAARPADGGGGGDVLLGDPRRPARPARLSRRRAGHLPDRPARCGHRRPRRHRSVAQRSEGRRGPQRGDRGADRDRRHRLAGPGLVRAGHPGSHRGGVAGSRRQDRRAGAERPGDRRGLSAGACGWRRCRWPGCCAPGCSTAPQRF